ncbi:putative UDP-arabinose 4-epimerase 1-like [Capsicum annuum]|nr:putative UDP-arabinose 4-epimerase 1-like [Capsicum annuum]
MCLNTRRADTEFWLHIQEHPLHYRILQYLCFCGFRGIVEVGNISYDVELISALVERWCPKTHTFHLQIGEATITLQDIEIMFGMVVDGNPILLEGSTDLGIVGRRQMMCDLTGWEPPLDCFCGIRRILVSKLAAYVKELDDITDDTPEIEVQQKVRLCLLWLCGGTLFSDKSNSKISLDYLIDLQDLNATSTKAWGQPHCHFYTILCHASMSLSSDVCGFLAFVQEGIIPLQPAPHPLWAIHHEASTPLARKWRRGIVHDNEARNILVRIRDVLNNLTIEQATGHETIYQMAQLILRDSRATSEMYGFASEFARISSELMNSAYLGTRLSFALNYAPPTQSAKSPPVQIRRQGRQSESRDSTRQDRRGGHSSMVDRREEPHDNFGLSLATTT